MYTNESLGFSFSYPSIFSDIVFEERPSLGGTGKLFRGSSQSNDLLFGFGGDSRDFSEGREGDLGDSFGYLLELGKYYSYDFGFASDPKFKPRKNKELTPNKILTINNKEILIFHHTSQYVMGEEQEVLFYYSYALLNLDNLDYPGMIFYLMRKDYQELSEKEASIFDGIMNSSKFID